MSVISFRFLTIPEILLSCDCKGRGVIKGFFINYLLHDWLMLLKTVNLESNSTNHITLAISTADTFFELAFRRNRKTKSYLVVVGFGMGPVVRHPQMSYLNSIAAAKLSLYPPRV